MYVFANAATEARARLAVRMEIFDPGTIRHLERQCIERAHAADFAQALTFPLEWFTLGQ